MLLHVHTSLQGTENQQDQNHHLEENQAMADALEILKKKKKELVHKTLKEQSKEERGGDFRLPAT